MNLVNTLDIYKNYQSGKIEVNAVKGVSLQIEKGEFTAIVGPSGSGKTSLLNLIGGLDNPSSGNIEILNTNLSELSERKRIKFRLNNIGFVFQAYNLIPVFTVGENVEFNMQLLKISKKERKERVLELLKELGLEDKINRRPNQLSGGEQQRVAVARALAAKPQFIIADEPTANLDSSSANNLLELMYKMCIKENITFVFSTHDQRVIEKANRVIVLKDGVIESDETLN